jgi:hypothetical protein
MKKYFTALIMLSVTLSFIPPSKSTAESHAIEISLQNCMHAKLFALHIIKRRNENIPITYYGSFTFESPAAMEIIQDAYRNEIFVTPSNKETLEIDFSEKWMNECFEFSCSGFWANLEIALAKIKDQ